MSDTAHHDGDATPKVDSTTGLDRTFAVMLAELEDHETELVQEQDRLARELQRIDGELERVATVKSAMLDAPKRKRGRPRKGADTAASEPSKATKLAERARENKERAMVYATMRGDEWWQGADFASHVDKKAQAVGPVLGQLARDGDLDMRELDGGKRREYRLKQTVETSE